MARYPILFTGINVALGGLGMPPSRSYVELDEETISARMGWAFVLCAPRSAISSVVQVQNPGVGWGWGVHGWRGHWLVNGSLHNVVRVTFDPPVPARAALAPVRLHTLDVSLRDPDGFRRACDAVPMDPSSWDRRVRGADAFTRAYDTTPPWDTGQPQTAIVDVAGRGILTGRVLDAGCGTGEHALLAASLGLDAVGVDVVPEAIAIAERKAAERGLAARFVVGDVLDLSALGEAFDTVVDSGLFHVLDDADRSRYVAVLRAVVPVGGRVVLLCFSDRVPGDAGPRRVSRDEIRSAFAADWHVEELAEASIDVAFGPVKTVHAWRATITRT